MNFKNKMYFVDRLTIASAWTLFWQKDVSNIFSLDPIGARFRFLLWVLSKRGIAVTEAEFFAGHLQAPDGENVRGSSRKMATVITMQAAERIINSVPALRSLNEFHGRNTLLLYISQQLQIPIEYWTYMSLVAQALSGDSNPVLFIKNPVLFDGSLLHSAFPELIICFYRTEKIGIAPIVRTLIKNGLKLIKVNLNRIKSHSSEHNGLKKPGVLMMQEEYIRWDRSLRNQPHWIDRNKDANSFQSWIIETPGIQKAIDPVDKELFKEIGVEILPSTIFLAADALCRKSQELQILKKQRHSLNLSFLTTRGISGKYFVLRIGYLLREAELMGAVASILNIKVFLTSEPQYHKVIAMQLAAPMLNIKTIAYQYSNLGFMTTTMMSTADNYILFSDMFSQLQKKGEPKPLNYHTHGYLYDYVPALVTQKANRHRQLMRENGAEFIICLFDESVQNNRWGRISKEDHLHELHELAKFVISDSNIGVIIKSQFMSNSPSNLYPNDELLLTIKNTGRYLELKEGVHRNDVFPTEAALASDLCINHKFGGTAGLESALAGIRCVLLEPFVCKSFNNELFEGTDIVYKDIESIIASVKEFRNGNAQNQMIGDWKDIIYHFDPFIDGKSSERMVDILNRLTI
jgi:hypothetical protein